MSNLLDGKVALVTGAANGLGREEALELARHGARVVVSDLGVASDGSGRDEGPARAVVEEIQGFGGEAVAHFGDVADWNDSKAMLQTALDTFGDAHILVNNAGFCRDKMLFKMEEDDFDAVVRVHLKGHFCGIRHVGTYWRDQSKAKGEPVYGRIVSTSSDSWLMGNVGQANYSPAKAGITSLTMVAARELQKYGVTANVIVPRARTRMNNHGFLAEIFKKPEEGFDTWSPENIAPLVAYLASPLAERISGNVFGIFGTVVRVLPRIEQGAIYESAAKWTPDALHEKLGPHFEKLEPIDDGFPAPMA